MKDADNYQDDFSLVDLVPQSWKENPLFENCLVEVYATALIYKSKNSRKVFKFSNLVNDISDHPVIMRSLSFMADNNFKFVEALPYFKNGKLNIKSDFKDISLPAGEYVFLFSPIKKVNGMTFEGLAYDSFNLLKGLISSVFGHAIFYKKVMSFEVNLQRDATSYSSATLEIFISPEEHDIFTGNIDEILVKVSTHLPKEMRTKIANAMVFLGRATGVIDSFTRFTHTWVALETVCGSTEKALEHIKVIAGKNYQANFKAIKDARDNLFHKAIDYQLLAEHEIVLKAAMMRHILKCYNLENKIELSPEVLNLLKIADKKI